MAKQPGGPGKSMAKVLKTRQQTATLRLRELVLSGHYAPGEWLREQSVSRQLGTSRTPARIAMQILEQEGLLRFYPRFSGRQLFRTADQ